MSDNIRKKNILKDIANNTSEILKGIESVEKTQRILASKIFISKKLEDNNIQHTKEEFLRLDSAYLQLCKSIPCYNDIMELYPERAISKKSKRTNKFDSLELNQKIINSGIEDFKFQIGMINNVEQKLLLIEIYKSMLKKKYKEVIIHATMIVENYHNIYFKMQQLIEEFEVDLKKKTAHLTIFKGSKFESYFDAEEKKLLFEILVLIGFTYKSGKIRPPILNERLTLCGVYNAINSHKKYSRITAHLKEVTFMNQLRYIRDSSLKEVAVPKKTNTPKDVFPKKYYDSYKASFEKVSFFLENWMC